MAIEIKTLDGVMNLDDSNDVLPLNNHREARNGVFKGNAPEMHFTAIRGNVKVANSSIITNDCKLAGSVLFTPNCSLEGTAVYVPKCELEGAAVLQVNFALSVTCSLNDGVVVINGITGGGGTYEIGTQAYSSQANALAGTSFTTDNTLTFNNMPDGTLWFVVRDKNNTSNKIAKSIVIACDGTSTECRSGINVVISSAPAEVFYQDCCGVSRSVSYSTVGNYTINDCIKGGSVSSPDSGFSSFTYVATACNCVNFSTTSSCVLNDGKIIIDTLTGGSGTYEIGNLAYFSAANAASATDFTTATSRTFNNMPDGRWYFVVRDKNNPLNKIVKFADVACDGTSNECRNGIDVVIGSGGVEVFYQDCCGVSRSVSYATAGSYTINDCIKAGSVSSPDNGFISYSFKTTACNCVDFRVTKSCVLNDGTVIIDDPIGGSGTYEIGNLAYASEAIALASTGFTEATTRTFNNMPDGTLWFVVRDKNNTLNRKAKSAVLECDGTSTECRNSVSVVISSVPTQVFYQDCCETVKSVTYNTAGTFTITDCILVGSLSSPDSGFASFTYSATTCECIPPDPTPNWVDKNFNVCIDCVSYDVFRDENEYSLSYLKYKVNDVIGTTTAPTESACNTTVNYSSNVGIYHICMGGRVNEYTIYANTNPCFTGNQYSLGTSGTTTYATSPVNEYPDTASVLTSQGYNTCSGCVNYLVYRDTNTCSPSWNNYFVNNVNVGDTAPSNGNCVTTANWTSQGYNTCSGCVNYLVYRDTNPCSATYNNYRVNDVNVGATAPSNGNCVTTPIRTAQNYNTCYQCSNYAVFRDTNPCSATFNDYILNQPPSATFINVGATAPSNGNCVTTANWQNEGARVCIDCTSYQPQRDVNPCSSTYNTTRNVDGVYGAAPCNTTTPSYTVYEGIFHYCSAGVVYEAPVYSNTNVCFSGVNTAQFRAGTEGSYTYYGVGSNPVNSYPDTTANWFTIPIESEWICNGTTKYYKEVDLNQCSPTGGQTRQGAIYATNSTDCGYVPIVCTSYSIYNPDENYDVNISYEECGGSMVYTSVGPGQTMDVCSVGNVSSDGGFITNNGSCSV
jgi:hypothetical protein